MLKDLIEEILRNRVLDITDEYKGTKREEGVQVYLGYPAELVDQLLQVIKTRIKERVKVLKEPDLKEFHELIEWREKHRGTDSQVHAAGYEKALDDIVALLDEELKT